MNILKNNSLLKALSFLLLPLCFIVILVSLISIDQIYILGYREGVPYERSLVYQNALVRDAEEISHNLYPQAKDNISEDDETRAISQSLNLVKSDMKHPKNPLDKSFLPNNTLEFWYWPAIDQAAYTNDPSLPDTARETHKILEHYNYVYDLESERFLKHDGKGFSSLDVNEYPSHGRIAGVIAFNLKSEIAADSLLAKNEVRYKEAAISISTQYALLAAAIFLGVLFMLYLIFTSGYRLRKNEKNEKTLEGPHLIAGDKLALELYFGFAITFAALMTFLFLKLFDTFSLDFNSSNAFYASSETILSSRVLKIWPIVLLPYIAILALQLPVLSFIRHVKNKTLFRNSICMRALRLSLRACTKMHKKIAQFIKLLFGADTRAKYVRGLTLYLLLGAFVVFMLSRTLGLAVFWLLAATYIATPFVYFTYRQMRSLNAIAVLEQQMAALRLGNFNTQSSLPPVPLEFMPLANELSDIRGIIKDAVERESKSERMKTELITNVSHDLRTPLTSIINYVDLLKQEPCENPKIKEYLAILESKSARLRQLTEDLIDASKALSGNLLCKPEAVNLPELLRQEAGEFSERFKERHLEMILRLPEALSPNTLTIHSDPRHLARILDNLLSNCAKYALAGTRVYFSLIVSEGKFTIEVKNISAERLDKSVDELFERFVRGDESRSNASNGLGLSIARSLAKQIGATLDIRLDDDLFLVILSLPLE